MTFENMHCFFLVSKIQCVWFSDISTYGQSALGVLHERVKLHYH
jgi:hypothetical protein